MQAEAAQLTEQALDPASIDPASIVPAPIVPRVSRDGDLWTATFPIGLRSMGGVMHGGAVVAAMALAASRATGRNVSTTNAHLHSGAEAGEARIALTELTSGRTSTTTRIELSQGRLRTSAVALLTADDAPPGLPITVAPTSAGEVPAPPPRALIPPRQTRAPGWGNSLDMVWVGDARPLGGGDEALVQGWIRPRTPTPEGAAGVVMLLDAMVPTLMAIMTEPRLIFTIEYTVHLTPAAQRPLVEGQWLFMRQHTVWAIGDLSVDDAELWTDEGELLGTARQMRRTMPPPPAAAAPPASASARAASAPSEGS